MSFNTKEKNKTTNVPRTSQIYQEKSDKVDAEKLGRSTEFHNNLIGESKVRYFLRAKLEFP